ncbi:MAG: B12-binding domain-containing radical SAM protein [Bacteroidales bacterium]|nr:B12-binding domain-containing radical SAM protein [Bacteroidales bacterium]
MRILLIQPIVFTDVEYRVALSVPYLGIKSLFAPHALATIAALTPPEHEVVIFDEAIEGEIEKASFTIKDFDIVGVHITTNLVDRCFQIASYFEVNAPKVYRVAGGIGISLISKEKTECFQSLFYGEAEETWVSFISDFIDNNPSKIYRKYTHPNMEQVPIPRWDLIKNNISKYGTVPIQTTRGCPFDCNFCNVIYTYGRKMRFKTIAQVIEEVKYLYSLGVKNLFFADDNFAGNKKYCKDLLKQLKTLNNSFKVPLTFMTQLDITIAQDDELLELLADSNFVEVMIGIESINVSSLLEVNKLQNTKNDITDAVLKIQSYGISVFAHMIAGFDNDTVDTFEHIELFFKKANLTEYLLHPLMAPPGTKLWYKYKRESRVIDVESTVLKNSTDIVPNIVPKSMSRVELMGGLLSFWNKVSDVEHNFLRAQAYIDGIQRIPNIKNPGIAELMKMRKEIFNTFIYFSFKANKKDRSAFLKLIRKMIKKSPLLVNRVIFLYTNYLMGVKRVKIYTNMLSEQIKNESKSDFSLNILNSDVPISENIIKNISEIFHFTSDIIIEHLTSKELAQDVLIESVTDFNDLFGADFIEFDTHQKQNLRVCTVRVINSGDWKGNKESKEKENVISKGLNLDNHQDLLNILDNNIRFKNQLLTK